MSNPFEQYGITHLSPSHLNLYAKSPAKWALCYLHGFKEQSPSMWRGSAVEAGILSYLRPDGQERDLDAAIQIAQDRFDMDALGERSPEIEKELAVIPGMVEQGTIALAGWAIPDATQLRVEYWFDGIEIPIVGYVDATWPEKGLEIKSTNQMPSEVREEHARQTGFYSICKRRPFEILYVTKSKFQLIPLEDPQQYMGSLEWTAHAIQNLLSAFPDKDKATRIIPAPDYDHPYLWKNAEARAAAAQIWR